MYLRVQALLLSLLLLTEQRDPQLFSTFITAIFPIFPLEKAILFPNLPISSSRLKSLRLQKQFIFHKSHTIHPSRFPHLFFSLPPRFLSSQSLNLSPPPLHGSTASTPGKSHLETTKPLLPSQSAPSPRKTPSTTFSPSNPLLSRTYRLSTAPNSAPPVSLSPPSLSVVFLSLTHAVVFEGLSSFFNWWRWNSEL